ncbi:MAG: CPBP family intramembrane glutamic endopeptidase [Candidatus Fermentibacteraceae bacterium]
MKRPVLKPVPRLLFAVLGAGLWLLVRMLLPGGSSLSSSFFSVLSILPTAALTVLMVPRAANRWSTRGLRWSFLTTTAALLVPLVLLLKAGVTASNDTAWAVALTLLALLLYALHEELVFRLFLADSLSLNGRFGVGTLLSSVLFTVVHLDNPFPDPLGMVNIFLAGIGLCLLRAMGGGLTGAVLAHFLWNAGIGVFMGYGVSGYTFPAFFRPAVESGAFGPEASPFLTVILAGLVAAGFVALRRGPRLV